MSNERSNRPSDSTTMGTSWLNVTQPIGCTFIRHQTVARQVRGAFVEIERDIVFPASPAEVWEALTEPERLEEWFATEAELDAQPGGEGLFRWGNGEERRAVVRAAEPGGRRVPD